MIEGYLFRLGMAVMILGTAVGFVALFSPLASLSAIGPALGFATAIAWWAR